jgi:hypothetical protein
LKKSDFKVIVGGLSTPGKIISRRFLSSFVTNTRLMGVVGLYINWEVETRDGFLSMHQYFYYDAEEFGFETYKSIYGNNVTELYIVEQTLIGGLGGDKVDLLEDEACTILQIFAEGSNSLSFKSPGKTEEYSFILDKKIDGKEGLIEIVMEKMCGPIESNYQVINYFLMRCFSKDFIAAKYLVRGDFEIELFPEYIASTLCKNSIKRIKAGNTSIYSCESLIEEKNRYDLLFTELAIENFKVVSCSKETTLRISPLEAGLLLSRPEYITLYEITFAPEDFDELMADATERAMVTSHENGKLYLAFNKNNAHVNKKEYRLNEDVYGLFYVTDFGQLIIASYTKQGIRKLETDIKKTPLNNFLMETGRFEFKEPVLYEFVNSDFDDFGEFLDFIRFE